MQSINIRNASRYSYGSLMLVFPPCTTHQAQILGDIHRDSIPLLCANPASDSIPTLDCGMAATASIPNSSASSLPFVPPCLAASCPPPPASCQIIGRCTLHSLVLYCWVSSAAFLPLVLFFFFSSALFCGLRLPRLFFLPQSRVLSAGRFLLVILLSELSL